jgi:hypothetical protein
MDPAGVAEELIEAHGRDHTPFGVYVLEPGDPATVLARAIERQVFYETFGNTPELLAAEYGPYEDGSVFLCVMDHEQRRAAGVLRLIMPSPAGLKSVIDLERHWGVSLAECVEPHGIVVDPMTMFDMATLGVDPDYQGAGTAGLVATALYQTMSLLAVHRRLDWAIAILDQVALRQINTSFSRPLAPIPGTEPQRYLDSASSQPVLIDVADYRARVQFLDPGLHSLLFEGRGLESAFSYPDWVPSAVPAVEMAAIA